MPRKGYVPKGLKRRDTEFDAQHEANCDFIMDMLESGVPLDARTTGASPPSEECFDGSVCRPRPAPGDARG
jgi:hypothetical protein